jgi:hypothetical protein
MGVFALFVVHLLAGWMLCVGFMKQLGRITIW